MTIMTTHVERHRCAIFFFIVPPTCWCRCDSERHTKPYRDKDTVQIVSTGLLSLTLIQSVGYYRDFPNTAHHTACMSVEQSIKQNEQKSLVRENSSFVEY